MAGDSDVTVGSAGDLISRHASASAVVAKAGGRPYFSGIQAPCQASALSCSRCNGPLSLVTQVQLAPAAHGEGNITRTLYMFCCTQESCASQTDSWRAFTHLVPKQDSKTTTAQDVSGKAAASAPQALPASATEASQGSAAAAADAWGLASDDWQTLPAKATEASKGSATVGADAWGLASDDWGVSTPEPAEADAAELNSALDQLSMQSCLHPQEQSRRPKAARDRQQTEPTPEARGCSIEGLPCLPAFELWLQAEPGKTEARLDRSDAVREAISAYEQSSASEGAQSGSSKPEGSWAHEQYEEDAAFSKYTKRLQRCPGQCLRLSTSGGILWPRKELPAVPRCSHCQTEKRCIAQLMAPLIAMLHEAADWVVEAGEDYIQDVPVGVPSSWEWLTVAVFACPGQCASSRTFEEETVIVVNETVIEGGWAY